MREGCWKVARSTLGSALLSDCLLVEGSDILLCES